MVQRIVDIKTDGLAVFEKETRSLVLCLEYCGMTIAMVDKSNGHWIAVEVLQCSEEDMDDMEELMQLLHRQSALLHYTGLETKIFIRTANAMLIPRELENDARHLLQVQFGLQKQDLVIKEQVNNKIAVALKINGDWLQPFSDIFPKASTYSSLGWLVRQTLEDSRTNALPILQTVFSNGIVEMVLAKSTELLLAKCFRFSTVEDMNYQLLNGCRQLGISPAEVAVSVQGLVIDGSPLHQSLLKYFAQVQFENAAVADWGVAFKTIPAHYFTSLIHAAS